MVIARKFIERGKIGRLFCEKSQFSNNTSRNARFERKTTAKSGGRKLFSLKTDKSYWKKTSKRVK